MTRSERCKLEGKCVTCRKPNDRAATHATCTLCGVNRWKGIRAETRKLAGLCTWCNKTNDRLLTHHTCSSCASKNKEHKIILKDRNRDFIFSLKLEKGCADCGYNKHSAALHFDHLPGFVKRGNVAQLLQRCSIKTLEAELAKCEVVCANCHAIRTWNRAHPVAEQDGSPCDNEEIQI